uniref:Uncharacterized protein n=1 Tax=Steinernema glaseri TaxID=37863 RepID=A0A1I7Z086_9BILA
MAAKKHIGGCDCVITQRLQLPIEPREFRKSSLAIITVNMTLRTQGDFWDESTRSANDDTKTSLTLQTRARIMWNFMSQFSVNCAKMIRKILKNKPVAVLSIACKES